MSFLRQGNTTHQHASASVVQALTEIFPAEITRPLAEGLLLKETTEALCKAIIKNKRSSAYKGWAECVAKGYAGAAVAAVKPAVVPAASSATRSAQPLYALERLSLMMAACNASQVFLSERPSAIGR
ncbi:hypothetical protein IW143_000772, partial [Coemansia sp. RSA 520]